MTATQIPMQDKRKLELKAPIFFVDPYLSKEQAKFKAQQASDSNFMREDFERAQEKFDRLK